MYPPAASNAGPTDEKDSDIGTSMPTTLAAVIASGSHTGSPFALRPVATVGVAEIS